MAECSENRPFMRIKGIVLDCNEPEKLADFYEKLLGWKRIPAWDGWAALLSPDESFTLAFQEILGYTPPTWPWEAGKQMQMVHFDIFADYMEEAVSYAIKCGAKKAELVK